MKIINVFSGDNRQKIYCITLGLLLSHLPLSSFLNTVFNSILNIRTALDTAFCYLILYVFIILTGVLIIRRVKTDIWVILFVLLVSWLISYEFVCPRGIMMYTNSRDIIGNPFYMLFIYSFFAYVVSRYICDYALLIKILARFSIAVVICSTLSFFTVLSKEYQAQYMNFSYNMTLQSTFLILYYFEKKNPLYLIIGLLGTSMILMAGCRGAIVSVAACLFIYVLFRKTKPIKKVILIGILCIVAILIMIYFKQILDFIIKLAESLNISSRTLNMLIEGEISNDSGRGTIQEQIMKRFNLFGNGLYSDRFITTQETYAHNFVLEIICHFGYILGTPILLYVFTTIFRGLFARNAKLRFLIIVCLSTGMFKLFLSSSYLNIEPGFYALLGLCMNAIEMKKKSLHQ